MSTIVPGFLSIQVSFAPLLEWPSMLIHLCVAYFLARGLYCFLRPDNARARKTAEKNGYDLKKASYMVGSLFFSGVLSCVPAYVQICTGIQLHRIWNFVPFLIVLLVFWVLRTIGFMDKKTEAA